MHVSYAFLNREESDPLDAFFIRQLSYPLSVTVYHMLECHEMDILPFPSYAANQDFQDQLRGGKKSDLVLEEDWGWCLFSVEVRNAYGLPFDVAFSRMENGRYSGASCGKRL
jgi:trafficking protein particle complex subunit 9